MSRTILFGNGVSHSTLLSPCFSSIVFKRQKSYPQFLIEWIVPRRFIGKDERTANRLHQCRLFGAIDRKNLSITYLFTLRQSLGVSCTSLHIIVVDFCNCIEKRSDCKSHQVYFPSLSSFQQLLDSFSHFGPSSSFGVTSARKLTVRMII